MDAETPHPRLFAEEPLARAAHESLAVTFGTTASYSLGSARLVRVGFANLPMLAMTVVCKHRDLAGIIPVCRQQAFGFLAERGVSQEHLAFRPTVTTGRRQKFTDSHGASKMGESHEVAFELSALLTGAVEWDWAGNGTLKAPWQA